MPRVIRIAAVVATSLLCASAFAQTNVPHPKASVRSVGKKGKDNTRIKTGQNTEAYKKADKNGDGVLDKAEFDAACSDRLFKEQDKAN